MATDGLSVPLAIAGGADPNINTAESVSILMVTSDRNTTRGIRTGEAVILVLHTPKEKCWGMLDEISAAGVFLRGLDLNAFDDWVAAVAHKEPFIGLTDLFFPMWRVERILRDETSGGVASLSEQVERRTGRTINELLDGQE